MVTDQLMQKREKSLQSNLSKILQHNKLGFASINSYLLVEINL